MGRADDVEPKKCTAVGGGVDQAVCGQKAQFAVTGMLQQAQLVNCTIEGPSQPSFTTDVDDNGEVLVSYTPQLPGDYKISVHVKGKQIKNSPYKVTVVGDSDPKLKRVALVTCQGKGILTGKCNTQNEFIVDTREANLDGGLVITIKNPERASSQLNINDNNAGTHKVQWKPTCPGLYVINVKVEGIHIPASPYYVRVF